VLKQGVLVDRGVLSASPRGGELAPGAEVVVTIRVAHVAADQFELPLLLSVESGKRLTLNATGRTLASREPYLHLPMRALLLGPTPLGLAKPQRHTLELPNYSAVPLAYELDTARLALLNAANFGFEVLRCFEPTGIIPPGGTARVPFGFQPLEARDFSLALPIRFGDAARTERTEIILVLRAVGHEPTDTALPLASETERLALAPPFQTMALPENEQAMRLSLDRCVFGRAPVGASVQQLVVLQNTSASSCDFEWDTSHPLYAVRASVFPSHGTVAPNGHACCKVTMLGAGPVESVQLSLACRLYPRWTEEQSAAAAAAAEASAAAQAGRSGRQSVTVVLPKLRGVHALQAMEERRQRVATLGGDSTPPPLPAPLPPQQTLLLDLSTTFLPAAALLQAGVELREFHVSRVLPPTAAELAEFGTVRSTAAQLGISPRAALSATAGVKAEQRACAEATIQQMVQELMGCDDVRHALELAPLEPIPWFAQLAHAKRGVAPAPVTITAAGVRPGVTRSVHDASSSAAAAAAVGDNLELEASLAAGAENEAEAVRAEAVEAVAKAAADVAAARVGEVMASAELQELAAYVLEGTLFNLITEASHGDFSLSAAPRQLSKPRDAVVRRKFPA